MASNLLLLINLQRPGRCATAAALKLFFKNYERHTGKDFSPERNSPLVRNSLRREFLSFSPVIAILVQVAAPLVQHKLHDAHAVVRRAAPPLARIHRTAAEARGATQQAKSCNVRGEILLRRLLELRPSFSI